MTKQQIQNQNYTINQCLDAFVALEELEENEKYMCEKCKSLQLATKRMILHKLSPVHVPCLFFLMSHLQILTLHLKRFRFKNNSRQKIDSHISFPLELDMNPYISNQIEGQIYSLYGVIVHRGSAGSGHYIAYIKHENRWFEMNDRKATLVDSSEVLEQSAYMLFYQVERAATILDPNFKIPKKRLRS